MEGNFMVCAGRRPLGRLFYWALVLLVAYGFSLPVAGAGASPQNSPATTTVAEQVELGGALELQHGDVVFTGATNGVIGGLYAGPISVGGCLAGFLVTPAGTGSNIQALISGSATGPVVSTTAGHRYV